jgi:hypothetical protein
MVVDCWSGDPAGLRHHVPGAVAIDNGSTDPVADCNRHPATSPDADRNSNVRAVAVSHRTDL